VSIFTIGVIPKIPELSRLADFVAEVVGVKGEQ
jgi:hypothetical protein